MLSLQLLYFHSKRPALVFPLNPNFKTLISQYGDVFHNKKKMINPSSSYSSYSTIRAIKKDSQQFEVDPEKAREALQKLDQQLQSLSNKQVSSPKIRASDVKLTREKMSEELDTEYSGSFLAYSAVALVLFTIFYNVLFYTVIKPSIDGP
ncbi:Protoheme IX farnesyltransferase [Quillaja saponaria]|uniref:Protoheme IX farnesyltransferase n=1 Tax=Quillaja saponaria TaxID=32244 RepID=A0AAD7PM26_QUISA|nr:Protoheme IX farnesyltransferase [Quillaja saponaria]